MMAAKGRKKPLPSTKSDEEDVDRMSGMIGKLIEQNKECLKLIHEQRAALDESTKVLKQFTDMLDGARTSNEPVNYIA